jgi:hypothetical protein
MKKYLFIAVIILFGIGWWGYEQAIDGCYISNFYLSKWPTISPTKKPEGVEEILNQPFTYLGKGRQFYVYASKDGRWVLKFVKCQRINVPAWYEQFPMPHFLDKNKQMRLLAKRERVQRLFTSMKLAQNRLSDITGVHYVHLKKTEKAQYVTLSNRLGFSTAVDINKVPFVLQRRAETAFSVLEKLYDENNFDLLQTRLKELVHLFNELVSRNVVDIDDGAFMRDNIGFLPDRAVYIDIGTFVATDLAQDRFIQDKRRFKPVIDWLQTKDQMLADSFTRMIE